MTKPVLFEWAQDQTSMQPTTQSQWEEGFKYLDSTSAGKVKTDAHDFVFSEITKAVRWTLDAIPDSDINVQNVLASNGYEVKRNGVIRQWGYQSNGTLSGGTINFLFEFPNECTSISMTRRATEAVANSFSANVTKSSFEWYNETTVAFYWEATGF